jgi:DNA-binding response OmpR family regulator
MAGDPHDNDQPAPAGSVRYGALCLDLEGYTVLVNDRIVPLTLTEFLLVKALALNPYHVFDRETLAQAVGDRGTAALTEPPNPRVVDLYVARARKKLHAAGYDCIQTMRYVGYRFVPLTQPSPRTAAPQ